MPKIKVGERVWRERIKGECGVLRLISKRNGVLCENKDYSRRLVHHNGQFYTIRFRREN